MTGVRPETGVTAGGRDVFGGHGRPDGAGDRTLLEHARWTVAFSDPTHATAKGQGQLGESRGDVQYKLEKRGDRRVIAESTPKRK